jgi:hypothetical protein
MLPNLAVTNHPDMLIGDAEPFPNLRVTHSSACPDFTNRILSEFGVLGLLSHDSGAVNEGVSHVLGNCSPSQVVAVHAPLMALAAIMRRVLVAVRRAYGAFKDDATDLLCPAVDSDDGISIVVSGVRPDETRILVLVSQNALQVAHWLTGWRPRNKQRVSPDFPTPIVHGAVAHGDMAGFATSLDTAYKFGSHFRSSMIDWLGRRVSGLNYAPLLLTTTIGSSGKGAQ